VIANALRALGGGRRSTPPHGVARPVRHPHPAAGVPQPLRKSPEAPAAGKMDVHQETRSCSTTGSTTSW